MPNKNNGSTGKNGMDIVKLQEELSQRWAWAVEVTQLSPYTHLPAYTIQYFGMKERVYVSPDKVIIKSYANSRMSFPVIIHVEMSEETFVSLLLRFMLDGTDTTTPLHIRGQYVEFEEPKPESWWWKLKRVTTSFVLGINTIR